MVRPEVVDYLRAHLGRFDEDDLRRQLFSEGISDDDFEDSLAVAKANAKPAPPTSAATVPLRKPGPDRKKALKLAAALGGLLVIALAALKLMDSPGAAKTAASDSSGESGFVGHAGWVVRLPAGYTGVSSFKDPAKTDEVVYFCPHGTDPTDFIDKDLFGQEGIIRLEVAPSDFPPNAAGVAQLSAVVSHKLRLTQFRLKNIQIDTMPAVQADILAPAPHIETYALGQSQLYFFYGGQEDQLWRSIVLSLRDAHSEN